MKKTWKYLKWLLIILIPLLVIAGIYGANRPLPEGVDFEGGSSPADVEVLIDQTLHDDGISARNHEIHEQIQKEIRDAEDFIIMDMFLFDDANNGEEDILDLAGGITDALVERQSTDENIDIVVITDPLNTMYGSYMPDHLKRMENAGIEVVVTDLEQLRDSNPVYSSFYRLIGRWIPQPENGLIPNFIDSENPNLTLSGLAEGLNMKANHRKTLVTEKAAIVTSWNPHNPSADHQNVGFRLKGEVQNDIIQSEVAVMNFSGHTREVSDFEIEGHETAAPLDVKLLTEKSIKRELTDQLESLGEGDEVMIGMFYLSDRDIITELKNAAHRGTSIRLILDQNQDAFGAPRPGVPNQPVAAELMEEDTADLEVKWGTSYGEQYHSKFMMIDHSDGLSTVIGGNSNWTRRNLENYNLEANVIMHGEGSQEVFTELRDAFDDQWFNQGSHMTEDYDVNMDEALWKRLLYRFQEFTGVSNF